MAQEIRTILKADPNLKGAEVLKRLEKKFPRQTINSNSFGVAYSNARGALGLRKKSRGLKPDAETLKITRDFVARAGSIERARGLLDTLESVQL